MQENYKVANATQNTQFKVGQTVWCLLYGKGEVVEIDNIGTDYPVEVCFENTGESEFYTRDGKYYTVANRTLFHSEPQVIAATEPVFEPKLVGKVVAVWCNAVDEFVETGEVAYEYKDRLVLTNASSYSKDYEDYTFHEVTPQPITFD